MATAAGDDVASIAAAVNAEMANPTGSRFLGAEVAGGDLSDPAVRDELRGPALAAQTAGTPGD